MQESYLGLQDALRKIRAPNGSHCPGAWARANICIKEIGGAMILILQEKWDQRKAISTHWLGVVSGENTALDFKHLQSDQGFLVYVTEAYPGMKPYLKGFHLSLQTWRGGRDREGWKLEAKGTKGEEQDEEGEGNNKSPRVIEDVKIECVDSICDKRQRAQVRTPIRAHKGGSQIEGRPGGNPGIGCGRPACNEMCEKQPHDHRLLWVLRMRRTVHTFSVIGAVM
jgi:hypothetical protein